MSTDLFKVNPAGHRSERGPFSLHGCLGTRRPACREPEKPYMGVRESGVNKDEARRGTLRETLPLGLPEVRQDRQVGFFPRDTGRHP